RRERSALIPQPVASLADAVAPVHRGDVETGHRGVPPQSLAFGPRYRLRMREYCGGRGNVEPLLLQTTDLPSPGQA
ncbi:MAG: hypothetical protein ACXVH3_29970, partial [Solirubrobacteraceae bacterium]